MKLIRVDFRNFRSACESLGPCFLEVDDEITCLIGTSESGKSNLLEAMDKFETGDFLFEDVPRATLTGSSVTPSDDLPIISATYRLDPSEMAEVSLLADVMSDGTLTLQRNYKGSISVATVKPTSTRSIDQIGEAISNATDDLHESTVRFLKSYSRQRSKNPILGSPDTRAASLRLGKLIDAIEDEEEAWKDQINEIIELFNRFNAAVNRLPIEIVDLVPSKTREAALERIQSLGSLVHELQSPMGDQLANFIKKRPTFDLVTSDPSQWLRGEYKPDDLLNDVSASDNPGIASAKLLLKLADLDFAELQGAPEYMLPDLLEQASDTVSERLNRYWTQEKIRIRFQIARTGNLIIYVESSGHRALPTQRSYGFRWYLEFLLRYVNARQSAAPTVLLFDEPGIHLHPNGQEDLKRLLRREISQHMQVIFTTQSPGMVDTVNLDRIRGVVKNEAGHRGTWVINEEYSPEHNQITWEVMLRAIGARGSGPFGPGRTIVLEGLSDRQYLTAMARQYADADPRYSPIVTGTLRLYPGTGMKSLKPICSRHIEDEATFCVLLDNDVAGNAMKKTLEATFRPPNEWFRGVAQIKDPEYGTAFPGVTKESAENEIEDLFGIELYSQMVNVVYEPIAKRHRPFDFKEKATPSLLKKAAEKWLEEAGEDAELIYKVANQFSDMLKRKLVKPSKEVIERFAVLIEYLSSIARPADSSSDTNFSLAIDSR